MSRLPVHQSTRTGWGDSVIRIMALPRGWPNTTTPGPSGEVTRGVGITRGLSLLWNFRSLHGWRRKRTYENHHRHRPVKDQKWVCRIFISLMIGSIVDQIAFQLSRNELLHVWCWAWCIGLFRSINMPQVFDIKTRTYDLFLQSSAVFLSILTDILHTKRRPLFNSKRSHREKSWAYVQKVLGSVFGDLQWAPIFVYKGVKRLLCYSRLI